MPFHGVRAQLVALGYQEIVECGLMGVSLREIQRRAGRAQTALFKYWHDRSEFFLAMAQAFDEETANKIRANRVQGQPAMASLFAALSAYIRQSVSAPPSIALPSARHILKPAISRDSSLSDTELEFRALADMLGAETGHFLQAPLLGSSLAALAEGMALAAARARHERPVEEFIERAQLAAQALVSSMMPGRHPSPA